MTVDVINFTGYISHTFNRYLYSCGKIYDTLSGERTLVNPDSQGIYYLSGLTGIFEEGINIEFAFCYSYYKFNGTQAEFDKVTLVSDGTGRLRPQSIYPKYTIVPKFLDEYRLIPGFSDYAVTKDGKRFYNVGVLQPKETSLNLSLGRYEVSLTSDKGNFLSRQVARMVMLAWGEYEYHDLAKDVDHINENRTDDHVDNLQWLSRSDNAKKNNFFRKNVPVNQYNVIDLDDPCQTLRTFDGLTPAAEYLGVVKSAIIKHCAKANKDSVIHNRYVVWKPSEQGPPNLAKCQLNRYCSSVGFSVMATNSVTGEKVKFEKVSEVLDDNRFILTKKTLTQSLKRHDKRVFTCGWTFEYEKDTR